MKIPPLVEIDTETGKARFTQGAPSDAAFVVVMPLSVPLIEPDNKIGACDGCGKAVQFRPENAELPCPKLCLACAVDVAENADRPGN